MGARYARAANGVMPGKLGLAPRRVLVAMALRSLDTPRGNTGAGLYYGGTYRLLGDLHIMPTKSTTRDLRRYIADLTELGLLTRVTGPAPGVRAVYRLNLPVDNLPP